MRTLVIALFGYLLVLSGQAWAVPVFTAQDIPTAPGTVTEYYQESDATVNIGASGPNRFWDFTHGSTNTVQTMEVVERSMAPFNFLFPAANSISYGPTPYGLMDENTWRYDRITESGWTTLGTTLNLEEYGVAIPIPIETQIMDLPLEYGDSWGTDISRDITLPVDILPIDIPIFEEIRIEVSVGGTSSCDGWGTIALPGGDLEALRVFTQIGAQVDAYGIFYLFGFPIEIPFGTIYELNAILTYSWYSPGYGEVAFAMSYPGEPDPGFGQAALVRRMHVMEYPDILTISATPNGSTVIPAQGGAFSWDLSLTSAYQHPIPCSIWAIATFPNGYEYLVDRLPLAIPANGVIEEFDIEQSVPGFIAPGEYEYSVQIGIYPNLVWAEDSISLTKLQAATSSNFVGSWTDCIGIGKLDSDQVAEITNDVTVADGFALSAAFPNPFNPTTSLTLTLPEASQVHLIVYNSMGHEVTVLHEGILPAGPHSFVVNGSNLSSGVYFVAAQIDGRTDQQVQKIVLMK